MIVVLDCSKSQARVQEFNYSLRNKTFLSSRIQHVDQSRDLI